MAHAPPRPAAARQELRYLLQIFGLCGFAVAQPVLDIFGRSPETFVFRGAGPREVILFAVILAVVPVAALWLVGLATRPFGPRVRRGAHWAVVGILLTILAIQVLKRLTPLLDVPLAAAGAVIGGGVTVLLARARPLRAYLDWTAVAPVAFVAIFLVASPAAKLLHAPDVSEAAAARTDAPPPPLVMVVFDEFPLLSLLDERGNLDAGRYPSFAALGAQATWYRNYTVNYPFTEFSIPTMLTGKVAADPSKKPLAVDYPDNLFTLLRNTHRLEVFEQVTELCPRELCSPEAPSPEASPAPAASPTPAAVSPGHGGLEGLIGDAAGIWKDLSLPAEITRDVTGQFVEEGEESTQAVNQAAEGDEARETSFRKVQVFYDFLDSFAEPAGRPGLHFAHVMLPHLPYRFYPSGVPYERLRQGEDLPGIWNEGPARWSDQAWPVQLTRQRHLLQAQYVDRLLGELIEELKRTGLYDQAVVVITSDHGQSFHPGRPWRDLTAKNLHETLWVPLLVKAPGQKTGGPDDANVTSMDLLPTLAAHLGVEVPWPTDGLPAADARVRLRGEQKVLSGALSFGKEDPAHPGQRIISARDVAGARRRLRTEAFRPDAATDDVLLAPYRVGPGARIVGRAVKDLPMGPPSPVGATLTIPTRRALKGVDTRSGPLPGLVWGSLGGSTARARVAAAVNGRVAGVSTTFSRGDAAGLFAVLVPDVLFRDGRNRLELFLWENGMLRPLSTS